MRIDFVRITIGVICFQFGATSLQADPECLTRIEQGDSCTTTCTCRGGCDLASERNLWDPNRLSLPDLMTI